MWVGTTLWASFLIAMFIIILHSELCDVQSMFHRNACQNVEPKLFFPKNLDTKVPIIEPTSTGFACSTVIIMNDSPDLE